MNAVLFQSQLLAIAREQIHVIVIAFVNLEDKQNSSCKSNQSCRKYPVDRLTQNYIPCLGHRGKKPYPV